jgi:uncharacterized protein YbjT (DUF2867 family)
MSYTALVAGGSGLVGGYTIDFLLQDPNCTKVISIGRRKLSKEHEKLEQKVVDFNLLEQHKDLFNVDRVFCCLGTTIKKAGSKGKFRLVDYDYPLKMAAMAEAQKVKSFSIITALGSDKNSKIFYNKVKGEVEAELETLQFQNVNVLQPSLLMGDREESRIGEGIAQVAFKIINPLFAGPLKKYKGIEGKQVAKAMVAIANQSQVKAFIDFLQINYGISRIRLK